jgi:UDP-N-acetylglucosamine--N-acetylmuramyl-(pentapeptide) pyrophosphoryl-undecaprenol N-acetylglucosamine transferase
LKIYLAAFGSGMGHASRMAAIADRLVTSGHDVRFSSSGEVTRWLQKKGYPCNDVPLVDVVFTDAGNFSATDTMKFFPLITARFCRQIEREVANLRLFEPHVVLSDTMVSTVVASRLLGIKSIAILNQLKLVSSPKTPRTIAKLLSGASMTVGNAFWELCDDILVPDLPPPYTISEQNLWRAGSASDRARYIGFLTPDRRKEPVDGDEFLEAWRGERRRRRVLWQISGPPATRGSFLSKALAVAKALEDEYLFAITAGNPEGGTTPVAVRGGYLYQWCKVSSAFLDSCDTVVSRAGHVSISDYVLRAKPSLLVPIQAQAEQIGNADKAERLGVAMSLEEQELGPQRVGEVLGSLSDGGYSDRVAELRKRAEGYDAMSSVLHAVGAN